MPSIQAKEFVQEATVYFKKDTGMQLVELRALP